MGRLTRAKAAEAAEKLHVLDLNSSDQRPDPSATPGSDERPPLEALNGVGREENGVQQYTTPSKSGSRVGADKTKASLATDTGNERDSLSEGASGTINNVGSPVRQATSRNFSRSTPEPGKSDEVVQQQPTPTAPPACTAEIARREAGKENSPAGLIGDRSSKFKDLGQLTINRANYDLVVPANDEPSPRTTQETPLDNKEADDLSKSEAMPNLLQSPCQPALAKTPTQAKDDSAAESHDQATEMAAVNGREGYDELEQAVVSASTPTRSKPKPPMFPVAKAAQNGFTAENSIASTSSEAAREPSAHTVAQVSAGSADDSLSRKESNTSIDASNALGVVAEEAAKQGGNAQAPVLKPKTKKAPIVKGTKASEARISLAHNPRDNRRVSSIGQPKPTSNLNGNRTASISSAKSAGADEGIEKKDVVIPHSKPRKMSMHFPPPPPPPKSSKAPTKSTFQLPGEAVAAKLKAAKDARLQKEAEDGAKKAFKARPAPDMTKTPAVRQTSASKARLSLMGGNPASLSGKRPNSVAGTRSSIKPSANHRSSKSVTTARMSNAPSQPSKGLNVSKRPSTVMGTLTEKSRSLVSSKPATSTTAHSQPVSTASTSTKPNGNGTAKGKEVFNRTSQAKSTAEKEKREKEEAAKQARVAASERHRQSSREWAEKQRAKKTLPDNKSAVSPDADAAVVAGAEATPAMTSTTSGTLATDS